MLLKLFQEKLVAKRLEKVALATHNLLIDTTIELAELDLE